MSHGGNKIAQKVSRIFCMAPYYPTLPQSSLSFSLSSLFSVYAKIVKGNGLGQGWATLFGLRATLETKMVYAGQYMYYMDLNYLNFEIKWA
jgi:hypothetical protein